MASERDFRAEAKAARIAARETLLAYREARRQSRSATSKDMPEAKTSGPPSSAIGPDSLFDMTAEDTAGPIDQAIAEDRAEQDLVEAEPSASVDCGEESVPVAPEIDAPNVQSSAELDAPDDSSPAENDAAELAKPSDITNTVTDDAATPMNPAEPASTTGEAVATVNPNSDLFNLPGAGAGIVWMFNQCGIHSLQDLASADPPELRQRLGVVGRILNIEPWTTFAREAAHQSKG